MSRWLVIHKDIKRDVKKLRRYYIFYEVLLAISAIFLGFALAPPTVWFGVVLGAIFVVVNSYFFVCCLYYYLRVKDEQ